MEEFVLTRAVDDGVLPRGYKLGTTVTQRRIYDTELASTVLLEKGYKEDEIFLPKSLKTIAQLEKVNKKIANELGELVQRPAGSPKLVKEKAVEDFV